MYCNAYQAFICGGLGNVNFCLSSFSSQFPKELDNVATQIFSEIDHSPLAVNNSADSYIFKYPLTKVTWFLEGREIKLWILLGSNPTSKIGRIQLCRCSNLSPIDLGAINDYLKSSHSIFYWMFLSFIGFITQLSFAGIIQVHKLSLDDGLDLWSDFKQWSTYTHL